MKNITILGNCTKDAEMRQAGSNNVASFDVAVNGFAKGEKTVTYFRVSVWGKRGDAVMQFAKKGAKICITGDFSTDEYNGKTNLNINASDFTPAGGGQSQGNDNQGGNQGGGGGSYGGGGRPSNDIDTDSIPFAPVTLI